MGAEASKKATCIHQTTESLPPPSSADNFPNMCQRESDAVDWTLLHQSTLDGWNEGRSDAAGFPGVMLKCDGLIHKDCSFSFCMSHQGIINFDSGSSIFSFRKRSKFAKMAEHLEYNHIPAQMSSINHFHVKSVICYCDSLVVLHLSRNTNSQFGLLDLRVNKFLGIFGKQSLELPSEILSGQLSPDRTKCLIRLPRVGQRNETAVLTNGCVLHLYDLDTKSLLTEATLGCDVCHFCFDPRFAWNRIAVTNFERGQANSLSLVHVGDWRTIATNELACVARRTLHPYLKDLCYTRDGRFVVASVLDVNCFCRENKTRHHRPIRCGIHVFSGDTAAPVHSVSFQRCVCTQHNCPVNYKPAFSICGSRMAIVVDDAATSVRQIVRVHKLPSALNLQNKCRVVILQNFPLSTFADLPLPQRLIRYLLFKPEFN